MAKRTTDPDLRSRLPRICLATLLVGLTLAACSDADKIQTGVPGSDGSPDASASASSSAPSSSEETLVTTRYVDFHRVVAESGATSNADDPRLADYATGAVLENLRGKLAVRRQSGTRLYGTPIPHVQSVSVSGDRATIRDCLDNSKTGLLDRAGKKLSVGRARQETTATLVRQGGVWKVSEITTIAGGGSC